MKEEFALLPPAAQGGFFFFEITAAWLVEADRTYDVHRHNTGRELILIHTEAGQGELRLADGRRITLAAGDFFAVSGAELHRYRTTAAPWRFSWWAGHPYGAIPFELCRPYRAEFPDGPAKAAAVLPGLRAPDARRRRLAMAEFQELLWHWIPESGGEDSRIAAALEYMHYHLDAPCRVEALARSCGLSVRHFRRCFEAETGKSPKQYGDELKLQTALGLLRNRDRTLKEIAAALGYSNSFHLSNAIRKRFGAAPKTLRRQPEGGPDGTSRSAT